MAEKKIVITEPVDSLGITLLKKAGKIVYLPELPGLKLSDEITDADALIVRVLPIGRDIIESIFCIQFLPVMRFSGFTNVWRPQKVTKTRRKL